jgi:uncharacterized membrane protein
MPFNFSITKAFKDSWKMFKQHWAFFMGLAFVMIILNLFTQDHHHNALLLILVCIAAVIWSYVLISVSLAAIDHKNDILNFKSLSVHMPTGRQFLMIIAIGLCAGIIVAVGFVLLIIPGIYFLTRLIFANTAYVDRQGSVRQSLEYSWHLVKGKIFWTVFLVLIIEIALIAGGTILFLVGALVTYPLAMLLVTHLYRALTVYHKKLA